MHDITRPHPGQIEVAQNIRRALQNSDFVVEWNEDGSDRFVYPCLGECRVSSSSFIYRLRQDRYSLRTAPQWIGPQIEEALSALHTITIEINSTTDNPIIDSRGEF